MSSQTRIAGLGYSSTYTNPTNIQAHDDTCAKSPLQPSMSSSGTLYAAQFGFSVPAGATVNGIEVTVHAHGDVDGLGCTEIRLGNKNGSAMTLIGTKKYFMASPFFGYPTENTDHVFGSSTDKWGATLTPDVVNNSNFGCDFIAINYAGGGATQYAYVDCITMTVYYTESAFVPQCSFM